jgi:hypothetical protein
MGKLGAQYKWNGIQVGETMLEEAEAAEAEAREEAVADGKTPPTQKFEPTDEQRKLVREMATAGIPVGHICLMVRWPHNDRPITYKTLKAHFARELFEGGIQTNTIAIGSLFASVKAGNVAAQIFWAKTRLGWRETTRHEVTGKDGAPMQQPSGVIVVPASTSPEEWEAAVVKAQADLAERAASFIDGGEEDA